MQTAQFKNWLWDVAGLSGRTIGARLSNCKRLEHYEGDLDEHFDADGMAHLLARLVYTATDERDGAPTRHRVPIYGNRRTGTATLKSAAVLYRDFRKSLADPFGSSTRDETMRRRQRSSWHGEARSSETDHRMGVFENWLRAHTELSTGSIGSYVANCKRLERYEGNLDTHFANDRMASLAARLTYSTADERHGALPRHQVPISGNLRDGTATLKSAATLYKYFLVETVGSVESDGHPDLMRVMSELIDESLETGAHDRESTNTRQEQESQYKSEREYWWRRIISREGTKQKPDPTLDDRDELERAEALAEQVLLAGRQSKTRKEDWSNSRRRTRRATRRDRRSHTPREDWPNWAQPREEQILSLAKVLTPFVRFLSPEIVAAVTSDNHRRSAEWQDRLRELDIDPDIYLWHGSPCAFPGIRRYAGSHEIAWYRKRIGTDEYTPPDALDLDDNDYPKHLWAFVFTGRPFRKQGPQDYRLAHLADHKDHNNRWREQFDVELGATSEPPLLYGLYTSPANSVYLPRNFLTPTDFSKSLRQLILHRAYLLYGSVCRIAPPPLVAKEVQGNSVWNPEMFEWSEPVGNIHNVPRFLEWRNAEIDNAFANR